MKPGMIRTAPQHHAEATGAPGWALASLSLCMLLSSLGTSIANVSLPTLTQAFNVSFQEVQWVVLAYLLAITTLIVAVGRLGDLIGRRRLMLIGLVLFTLTSVLCGAAPTLWTLIAARAAQGLAAAIMMALTLAFVADAIPKERTGSAMGLLGTMSAVGTALGPALGGLLIAGLGWRSIFYINLPLGAIALLLVYRYLPMDRTRATPDRSGFDFPGALLLGLTLAAYALATTLGRGSFGLLNVALLFGAIIGAGLFVLVETRSAAPLIRLSALRDPVLGAGLAMNILVTTVVMATLVVGPFYLHDALALDSAQIGLVMSVGPIVSALTGVPAGRMVDRLGARRIGMAGLISMAAGCSALALTATHHGIVGYIAPLVFITAGYALFQAANNTAVMTNIQADQRGVISGMLNLSRNLGLITGASAMGAVFAIGSTMLHVSSTVEKAAEAGMRTTFAVATALLAAALALTLAGRARSQRAATSHPET
jgi:EmrB/QacA subfamily drug resistance transporter